MKNIQNFYFNNIEPEKKSYIYQQLIDFEPFLSSNTSIGVILKDGNKNSKNNSNKKNNKTSDETSDNKSLKKENKTAKANSKEEVKKASINSKKVKSTRFKVIIVFAFFDHKIEEVGISKDFYLAFRKAKSKLIKTLTSLQNALIDYQERRQQIDNVVYSNGYLH